MGNFKHGMYKTRIYEIWKGMRKRCTNPKSQYYKIYGGRGISICDEWDSFENFYKDMSDGYEEHLSLDRKDNNLGYCKDNCKWSTPEEQARNHRRVSSNSSGVTGVAFGGRAIGRYAVARWIVDGKRTSKCFSVLKYGEDEAFRLACECRELKIKELNNLGYGYSESHGL